MCILNQRKREQVYVYLYLYLKWRDFARSLSFSTLLQRNEIKNLHEPSSRMVENVRQKRAMARPRAKWYPELVCKYFEFNLPDCYNTNASPHHQVMCDSADQSTKARHQILNTHTHTYMTSARVRTYAAQMCNILLLLFFNVAHTQCVTHLLILSFCGCYGFSCCCPGCGVAVLAFRDGIKQKFRWIRVFVYNTEIWNA